MRFHTPPRYEVPDTSRPDLQTQLKVKTTVSRAGPIDVKVAERALAAIRFGEGTKEYELRRMYQDKHGKPVDPNWSVYRIWVELMDNAEIVAAINEKKIKDVTNNFVFRERTLDPVAPGTALTRVWLDFDREGAHLPASQRDGWVYIRKINGYKMACCHRPVGSPGCWIGKEYGEITPAQLWFQSQAKFVETLWENISQVWLDDGKTDPTERVRAQLTLTPGTPFLERGQLDLAELTEYVATVAAPAIAKEIIQIATDLDLNKDVKLSPEVESVVAKMMELFNTFNKPHGAGIYRYDYANDILGLYAAYIWMDESKRLFVMNGDIKIPLLKLSEILVDAARANAEITRLAKIHPVEAVEKFLRNSMIPMVTRYYKLLTAKEADLVEVPNPYYEKKLTPEYVRKVMTQAKDLVVRYVTVFNQTQKREGNAVLFDVSKVPSLTNEAYQAYVNALKRNQDADLAFLKKTPVPLDPIKDYSWIDAQERIDMSKVVDEWALDEVYRRTVGPDTPPSDHNKQLVALINQAKAERLRLEEEARQLMLAAEKKRREEEENARRRREEEENARRRRAEEEKRRPRPRPDEKEDSDKWNLSFWRPYDMGASAAFQEERKAFIDIFQKKSSTGPAWDFFALGLAVGGPRNPDEKTRMYHAYLAARPKPRRSSELGKWNLRVFWPDGVGLEYQLPTEWIPRTLKVTQPQLTGLADAYNRLRSFSSSSKTLQYVAVGLTLMDKDPASITDYKLASIRAALLQQPRKRGPVSTEGYYPIKNTGALAYVDSVSISQHNFRFNANSCAYNSAFDTLFKYPGSRLERYIREEVTQIKCMNKKAVSAEDAQKLYDYIIRDIDITQGKNVDIEECLSRKFLGKFAPGIDTTTYDADQFSDNVFKAFKYVLDLPDDLIVVVDSEPLSENISTTGYTAGVVCITNTTSVLDKSAKMVFKVPVDTTEYYLAGAVLYRSGHFTAAMREKLTNKWYYFDSLAGREKGYESATLLPGSPPNVLRTLSPVKIHTGELIDHVPVMWVYFLRDETLTLETVKKVAPFITTVPSTWREFPPEQVLDYLRILASATPDGTSRAERNARIFFFRSKDRK